MTCQIAMYILLLLPAVFLLGGSQMRASSTGGANSSEEMELSFLPPLAVGEKEVTGRHN